MADNTGRIIAPLVQADLGPRTGYGLDVTSLEPVSPLPDSLRLLAIREAVGGFAGAVSYMVKDEAA
jgi:hypothetical protein